jgi:hypothetical protein
MTSSPFLRLLLEAKKAEEKEKDALAVAVQERENLEHSPTLWITFKLDRNDEVRHVPIFYKCRRLKRRSD